MLRALITIILLVTGQSAAMASDNRWPAVAAGVVFTPTSGCEKPSRRTEFYDNCADQMVLFTKAHAEATAAGKTLLVVFGATWCPSCKGLKTALPAPLSVGPASHGQQVHVVEIALSTLVAGRVAIIPSGEAVRANLTIARPDFKQRAIPFLAAINPVTGRTSVRNLDDLEYAGTWNEAALSRVVDDLVVGARGGAKSAHEPGWLMRKWRRWTGS